MHMSVSLIGIDGTGKSTLTPLVARLVSAECGLRSLAVGESCWGFTPEEDLFQPNFNPLGLPLSAHLEPWFHRTTKAVNHNRKLYPPLKVMQMALQSQTAKALAKKYQADVVFKDGDLLLSSAGRAINYLDRQSGSIDKIDIEMLANYIMRGQAPPKDIRQAIPGLSLMRRLKQLDQSAKWNLLTYPDAIIFLKINPRTALNRLVLSNQRLDYHENLLDLNDAQTMYENVVHFFAKQKGQDRILTLDVTHNSIEQSLKYIVDFIRTLSIQPQKNRRQKKHLGISQQKITKPQTLFKKALNRRYLFNYLFPNLHRGGFQELTFILSKPGRQFLAEGYSAKIMRLIYQQDQHTYNWLERCFFDYPLHQAVANRFSLLKQFIQHSLEHLNQPQRQTPLKILSAPCGYSLDLLETLPQTTPPSDTRLVLSDLDPTNDIQTTLRAAQQSQNFVLDFIQGDLTTLRIRDQLEEQGPYDLILFIGLSSWIAKPDLLKHLKLLHHLLAPGGILLTDCFTPQSYALSGQYIGYQASYYDRKSFSHLLSYCGFDTAQLIWHSEEQEINHLCMVQAPPLKSHTRESRRRFQRSIS